MEIYYLSKPYKEFSGYRTDYKTYLKLYFLLFSGDCTAPYGIEVIEPEVKNGMVKTNIMDIMKWLGKIECQSD